MHPGTEILGKYQIGDSIGHGAFGKVYTALNVQTGDFIAIKQIEKAVIQPEHLPGILRECELLRTLNHPNIVTFIDSNETDEYLYYIMEYIEGGSISKLVKKFGPFPESLLAHYISQVLKGLQYLHSQGVIHRDIKGENVLVTKQGVIKLVDFGSCTYQAMDKMLTVVGTPFWMAPEIIEMDGSARNTACDIWSLGCTIIELSTGFPPFWELGPMPAMFAMVNNDHPPLPSSISEGLKDFLLSCFTKEIHKRPSAVQLLEHPWIVAALKKTEKIDLEIPNSPEEDEHESTMLQLKMENENLRSTVKSLKQHMLKMMRDQKGLRAKIETLETELMIASKLKHSGGSGEGEPTRQKAGSGGIGPLGSPSGSGSGGIVPVALRAGSPANTNNMSYLATGASLGSPLVHTSSDRLFSPTKARIPSKPLPPPPVQNGTSKIVGKPATPVPPSKPAFELSPPPRLSIEEIFSLPKPNSDAPFSPPSALKNVESEPKKKKGSNLQVSFRKAVEEENANKDDTVSNRLRSSSEPTPSPFLTSDLEAELAALANDSPPPRPRNHAHTISSPRIRARCGTCVGCADEGPCVMRISAFALSPPQNAPVFSKGREAMSYLSSSPQPRAGASTVGYGFSTHRGYATSSTPNLPHYYDDVGRGGGSPTPGSSGPLKPGDECVVRSSTNTWHRAIVDEVIGKKSAIVILKTTGKKEEVLLKNLLTKEAAEEKKNAKDNTKRKPIHVANIWDNK